MIRSLYVHIPFCKKKCNYCDFISYGKAEENYEKYIEVLLNEFQYRKKTVEIDKVDTLFIGGGTPTVLPLPLLERLLKSLAEGIDFSETYEFTVEANPESLTKEKLVLMKEYGVNRLSIGVQSFNDQILQFLGRSHDKESALRAFRMSREVGYSNINLDFIYGVPGESPTSWGDTLRQALELDPEHISMYQLKIEEETVLSQKLQAGEFEVFPDDEAERIYLDNLSLLFKAGYENYEISNYAKPGYESRHNLTYWNYEPYLALGFGGVSFLGDYRANFAGSFSDYLKTKEFSKLSFAEEVLTKKEQISEFVIMNLRKSKGFRLTDFSKRFNVSFLQIYSEQTEMLLARKLIMLEDNRVYLTLRGKLIGNLVLEEFVG